MQEGFNPLVVIREQEYRNATSAPFDEREGAFCLYLHASLTQLAKLTESKRPDDDYRKSIASGLGS